MSFDSERGHLVGYTLKPINYRFSQISEALPRFGHLVGGFTVGRFKAHLTWGRARKDKMHPRLILKN